MRMPIFALAVGAVFAAPLAALRPAAADAMASPAAMDCDKASSMMMKAMPAMPAMDAMEKMSVDQQFAHAMMAQNKSMMAMAKVEAQCGKDPKARAMAKRLLEHAMSDEPSLEDLTKHSS